MAKKKIEFVANVEDKKEEKQQEYKDVHETSLTDIIGEPAEEELVKAEEPAKEEVIEKPEDKEVEFDPAKFKEDIVNEIVSKTTQTKTEVKDEYADFEKEIWDKEKRTPTYKEALEFVKISALKSIKEEQQKEVEAKQAEEKTRQEAEKTQIDSFNKYVDEQIDDLKVAGKITTDDEKKALFQAMLEVNTQRAKENKPLIYSVKEIFYEHYKKPNQQPAGADAPVATGRGPSDTTDKELDYSKDVHSVPRGFANDMFNILTGKR